MRVQLYMCAYNIPTCPWLPFQFTLYGFLPSTISYISGLYLRIMRMLKYLKYYNIHSIRNISFRSIFPVSIPVILSGRFFMYFTWPWHQQPSRNDLTRAFKTYIGGSQISYHTYMNLLNILYIYMELYCSNNKYSILTQRYWSVSFTIYKI